MKVLLITMDFPPFRGGIANYYYNLLANIKDIEFTVLTQPDQSAKGYDQQQKFKIMRPDFFYRSVWPRWLKLYFESKKIIKKNKFDLIWVGQVLPVGTVVYLIHKILKIPYFVSAHGFDILLPQQSARKKWLMAKILKSAEFVTANSRFTKNQLIEIGLAENLIEVIYPGANISTKNKLSISSQNLKEKLNLINKKILLTVGRLVKRKNQTAVVLAVKQLLEKYPTLVYLIVGDGPELNSLKSLVSRENLNNQVIFLTDIDDYDLKGYYQISDIFIMPAQNLNGDVEGFGLVYLEAAENKVPVIAGNTGGSNEAVINQQTGLLVDPDNIEEIKQAITLLLDDRQLRDKLVEQAYLRCQKEFNWEKQADKLKARIMAN